MKNTHLFIGFGLVLMAIALAFYYLLEDTGRNALITGALAGLGCAAAYAFVVASIVDRTLLLVGITYGDQPLLAG